MNMRMRMVSAAALAAAIAAPAFAQDAVPAPGAAPGPDTAPAQGTTTTEPRAGAQPVAGAMSDAPRGGIQEIVVTAQKRAENVQDVPIAITAFTATALQERAVNSVAGLSGIAPNVTLDAGTPFSGSTSVLGAISAASDRRTSPSTSIRASASTWTASISPARSAPTRTCSTSAASRC